MAKEPKAERRRRSTGAAPQGEARVSEGLLHIHSTFNNTIVTITDCRATCWSGRVPDSAGSRVAQGTPFAAQVAAEAAARRPRSSDATHSGQREGPGRDASRAAESPGGGVNVSVIKDVTPIPHNGRGHRSAGGCEGLAWHDTGAVVAVSPGGAEVFLKGERCSRTSAPSSAATTTGAEGSSTEFPSTRSSCARSRSCAGSTASSGPVPPSTSRWPTAPGA